MSRRFLVFKRGGSPLKNLKKIGLIGLGKVGTALAFILLEKGYLVKGVIGPNRRFKDERLSQSGIELIALEKMVKEVDCLFITTPDRVISQIVDSLQGLKCNFQAVLHMSGTLTSEILSPLRSQGILIGSLHPLQSFADIDGAIKNLPGSLFTYEGDQVLADWVKRLVEMMGGSLTILPNLETKALYHTGASIASNYLIAILFMATECLRKAGFSGDKAKEALLPLMQGTLNNMSELPLADALTGPISRGDIEVVNKHILSLNKHLPEMIPIYRSLGSLLAHIAYQSNQLTKKQYRELISLLDGRINDGHNHSS